MIDLKKLTLDGVNKIADLGGRIGDIADVTNFVPNLFCYGYIIAKSGNSIYLKGTTSVTARRIYNGKIGRYLKNGLSLKQAEIYHGLVLEHKEQAMRFLPDLLGKKTVRIAFDEFPLNGSIMQYKLWEHKFISYVPKFFFSIKKGEKEDVVRAYRALTDE